MPYANTSKRMKHPRTYQRTGGSKLGNHLPQGSPPLRGNCLTRPLTRCKQQHQGFTLVELVIVIIIVGILSVLGGSIITTSIEGYLDMSRRAELVGSAGSALRRMQRDVRSALPNSIPPPYGSVNEIRFVYAPSGGRYRAKPNATGGGDVLKFEPYSDNSTNVIGSLYKNASGQIPEEVQNGAFVVGNTNPNDVYSKKNMAQIENINSAGDHIQFNSTRFSPKYRSPTQRFSIATSEVRYAIEGNRLVRYERDDSNIGGSSWETQALVTRHVVESKSEFTYHPGTPWRSALLTLKLTLQEEGESISLLHEVHVLNTP